MPAILSHLANHFAALTGIIRWKCAMLLVSCLWRHNADKKGEELFRIAWRLVGRWPWLFRGHVYFGNRSETPWRNLVLGELLKRLRGMGRPYVPALTIRKMEDFLWMSETGRPVIIVFSHASGRLLGWTGRVCEAFGRKHAVTAVGYRKILTVQPSAIGLCNALDLIPRDRETLMALHQRIRQGAIVACAVDYSLRKSASLYYERFVSPTLFTFAPRIGSKVVFAFPVVADDGRIEVALSVAPENAPPEEVAEAFRAFLEATTGRPIRWQCQPWSEGLGAGHQLKRRAVLATFGQRG